MDNAMLETIILVAAVVYSIALHEVGHAVAAYWCGDDTAKNAGRITFNPIPSIDPLGSIVVPTLLVLFPYGLFFGWAKPVTVLPERLRPKVLGDIFVSLAGIIVNVLIAFLCLLGLEIAKDQTAGGLFYELARMNVILAALNLLPIPPLDGHHVFKYLLPRSLRGPYQSIGFLGVGLFFAAFYLVPGVRGAFQRLCGWIFQFVNEGAVALVGAF